MVKIIVKMGNINKVYSYFDNNERKVAFRTENEVLVKDSKNHKK